MIEDYPAAWRVHMRIRKSENWRNIKTVLEKVFLIFRSRNWSNMLKYRNSLKFLECRGEDQFPHFSHFKSSIAVVNKFRLEQSTDKGRERHSMMCFWLLWKLRDWNDVIIHVKNVIRIESIVSLYRLVFLANVCLWTNSISENRKNFPITTWQCRKSFIFSSCHHSQPYFILAWT